MKDWLEYLKYKIIPSEEIALELRWDMRLTFSLLYQVNRVNESALNLNLQQCSFCIVETLLLQIYM